MSKLNHGIEVSRVRKGLYLIDFGTGHYARRVAAKHIRHVRAAVDAAYLGHETCPNVLGLRFSGRIGETDIAWVHFHWFLDQEIAKIEHPNALEQVSQ